MRKLMLAICLFLIGLAGTTQQAQAGGRFFFGFGIGFGGSCQRCNRSSYAYGYYPYAYRPYYGNFVAYGYQAPVRYYVAPYYAPYRVYTLHVLPRRVEVPRRIEYQHRVSPERQKSYGQYVPRRYVRLD
jgi:hypothetical protein